MIIRYSRFDVRVGIFTEAELDDFLSWDDAYA